VKYDSRIALTVVAVASVCLLFAVRSVTQSTAQSTAQSTTPKEAPMPAHATGPFDVKVAPVEDSSLEKGLSRMSIDKQYHGDLEAVGKGQMLAAGSPQKGAGGYVAIEKVTGTLQGHAGSFVLQHSGTMKNNVPQLTITVVPESGTGELEGIAGTMTIKIAAGGKHSYEFEYTLPTHL